MLQDHVAFAHPHVSIYDVEVYDDVLQSLDGLDAYLAPQLVSIYCLSGVVGGVAKHLVVAYATGVLNPLE